MQQTAKQYFEQRRSDLRNERATWQTRAKDIARHLMPEYDRFDRAEDTNRDNASFDAINDSTAVLALRTCTSGLKYGITNPNRDWLASTIFGMQRDGLSYSSKLWLETVNETIKLMFTRSNLYRALSPWYREFLGFGTSAAYVCEDDEAWMRIHNFAPGEYYLDTDYTGRVNACYRDFRMTVSQLVEEFGLESVSRATQDAFTNKRYSQWVSVTHAIEPRKMKIEGLDDFISPDKKFRDVYFECGAPDDPRQGMLRVGGFYEFPIMTARLNVVSNNVYGYGLAHLCLGDIKQLQYQAQSKVRAIEQIVDPTLKAPAGTDINEKNRMPGETVYYDAALGAQSVGRLIEMNINLNDLREDIGTLQQRIKETFFVDVFRLFSTMSGVETATETRELAEEKYLQLEPIFEPVSEGGLDVLYARAFGIGVRKQLFPPPPEELYGRDLRPEYLSITSQQQKMERARITERMIAFIGNLAAMKQDPAVWDTFQTDRATEDYAESIGLPHDQLLPSDEVADMRAQRQAMQYAQQATSIASDGAKAVRNLGTAKTDGKTALTDLADAVKGQPAA